MSVNRFTNAKAAFLHQGQTQQQQPKPTSNKAAILHSGQRQRANQQLKSALAAIRADRTSITQPSTGPLFFTIYVRSFESSARFARPMTSRGDNRTFTTRVGKRTTARIHLQIDITIDLGKNKIFFATKSRSDETLQYCYPFYPFTFERSGTARPKHATSIRQGKYAPIYEFNVQAAEPIMAKVPLVGGVTPNISLHGFFSFYFLNNDTLTIYGKVYGDGFPDAECFVVDAGDKAVLLGTYKHGPMGSPIWDLPGEGNMQMMDINVAIDLDCQRHFLWGQRLGHSYSEPSMRNIPTTPTKLAQ